MIPKSTVYWSTSFLKPLKLCVKKKKRIEIEIEKDCVFFGRYLIEIEKDNNFVEKRKPN